MWSDRTAEAVLNTSFWQELDGMAQVLVRVLSITLNSPSGLGPSRSFGWTTEQLRNDGRQPTLFAFTARYDAAQEHQPKRPPLRTEPSSRAKTQSVGPCETAAKRPEYRFEVEHMQHPSAPSSSPRTFEMILGMAAQVSHVLCAVNSPVVKPVMAMTAGGAMGEVAQDANMSTKKGARFQDETASSPCMANNPSTTTIGGRGWQFLRQPFQLAVELMQCKSSAEVEACKARLNVRSHRFEKRDKPGRIDSARAVHPVHDTTFGQRLSDPVLSHASHALSRTSGPAQVVELTRQRLNQCRVDASGAGNDSSVAPWWVCGCSGHFNH